MEIGLGDIIDGVLTAAAYYYAARPVEVSSMGKAQINVPTEKFEDYIFKEGATHGKNIVFENLGYGKENSEYLANLYKEQAMAKYNAGYYTFGKLDQYGQRINIEIELQGIGAYSDKISYLNSGWMIKPDGSISLNTPFAGFTR